MNEGTSPAPAFLPSHLPHTLRDVKQAESSPLEVVADLCMFMLYTMHSHHPSLGIKFFSFAEFGM